MVCFHYSTGKMPVKDIGRCWKNGDPAASGKAVKPKFRKNLPAGWYICYTFHIQKLKFFPGVYPIMTKKEKRKTLFFAIFFTFITIVSLCVGKADSRSATLLFAVFALIDWARLFYNYIRFHK